MTRGPTPPEMDGSGTGGEGERETWEVAEGQTRRHGGFLGPVFGGPKHTHGDGL